MMKVTGFWGQACWAEARVVAAIEANVASPRDRSKRMKTSGAAPQGADFMSVLRLCDRVRCTLYARLRDQIALRA
jgi:hypothetical protein